MTKKKDNLVLEQERGINLTSASAKTIFDLVENPPAPNERLKAAMKRRKEVLCRK